MDNPDMVEVLRTKATNLTAQANALLEEAARYRDAAELIRGTPRTTPAPARAGGGKKGPNTTMTVVREVLARSGMLRVSDLASEMLASGWITSSTNPENTLRGALNRLEARGEVVKTIDGRYRAPQFGDPPPSLAVLLGVSDDDDTAGD